MALVVCFVLGAGASAVLWRLLRTMFTGPLFTRTNYRGRPVPVAAGVVAVLAVVVASAVVGVVPSVDRHFGGRGARLASLAVVLGFGLLGLLDDLAEDSPAGAHGEKGFAGHLQALRHGRLTTGGLKLLGGGLISLAVVASIGEGAANNGWLVVDAALVALTANLVNLLDRAPGRATKAALGGAMVLAVAVAGDSRLAGVALMVGAAAGLLVADLREELMLGDAGAIPIGAALGLGVVLTCGHVARLVVTLVLLALNLVSEKVSFSRVIEATGLLRALDRLGRRRR